MKAWIPIGAVTLGIGIAVCTTLPGARSFEHADRRDGAARGAPRDETPSLASDWSAAAGRVDPRPSAPPPVVPPTSGAGMAASARPAALTANETRDRLEVYFRAGAAGSSWTQGAIGQLQKNVTTLLPSGGTARSVECRGSLCRVEATLGNIDEYRTFMHRAFLVSDSRVGKGGAFASLLTEPTAAGPVVMVAYIAAEGSELPSPDLLGLTPP